MSEEPSPNGKLQPLPEEVYVSTRQSYDAAELEVSGRYDKWILTLAGGALGLSITFIEKIAKDPTPDTLCWLKGAWSFLIVALLLALVSLVTSQSAIRENRSELDSANAEGRAPDLSFPKWFTKLTNWLNWTSLASFIVGVILLCIFSFKNIDTSVTEPKKGADNGKRQTTNTTAKTRNGGVRSTTATTTEARRTRLRSAATPSTQGEEIVRTNGVVNEHQEDRRRITKAKQEDGGGLQTPTPAETPSETGKGQEDE